MDAIDIAINKLYWEAREILNEPYKCKLKFCIYSVDVKNGYEKIRPANEPEMSIEEIKKEIMTIAQRDMDLGKVE